MGTGRFPTGVAREYVSVLGLSLMHALVALLNRLEGRNFGPANAVQASNQENGLAAGVVILAATVLESALNRTRYVRRNSPRKGSASQYLAIVTRDPDLAADVEECFAVRDAVIHNHVWKAFVTDYPNGRLKFWGKPRLRTGYGDLKFDRVRRRGTRLTRRLGLNLFPTRIGRSDALLVVKTVVRALTAIENRRREYFPFSEADFYFRGAYRTLPTIADALP